jgi:tetratricopeptide (TPR) repeat protein
MRSLSETAAEQLRAFLTQRDDLIMILSAADGDVPAGLKIVEGLEAELSHVWGWVFAQAFTDAPGYVDAIIGDISARQAAMSMALEKQGKPALPPLPEALNDQARGLADRLRAAVAYVRSMVPPMPGGVTLFALLPLEIREPAAYAALARDLVRHRMPFPWCAGVRFVLRDDAALPLLVRFQQAARTRSMRIDFSAPSLAAALVRDAADETVPLTDRMNATLVAAGMDQAHGRFDQALARYQTALQHFGPAGNAPVAALAANGIAACLNAKGDAAGAERVMQAALDTSLQANPPALPVILNVLLDLTMLVARQARWAEAELYLTATHDVANALFMPAVRAEALDRRGIAQVRLGKAAEAERSWRDAIAIADAAEEHDHALATRTHLHGLLQQQGRTEEARNLAREIAHLRQAAAPGHTHAHTPAHTPPQGAAT